MEGVTFPIPSSNSPENPAGGDNQALRELAQKIEDLIYFPEKIEKPAHIPKIWEIFSAEIQRYVETDVCALFRVNDQTRAFDLTHWTPTDSRNHCQREIDAQIECGMFAWIINRRQPALIPSLVFKNHKTLIMLPLTTQTKTIGLAMVVTGLPEGAMTHERLKLLAILAKQCALIMENTLLYTALQNEHESLQKAQNRIIQAEKFAAFGRMTAGAFHEFLNPLNIVSGHLQLMQMMDLPPDQVREVAALMQTQADRMATMIKSLQRFSAPRKRTCQVLDIAPLVAQALENTRSRHPSPAVHCEINVADGCPPVNVPSGDISRVLENLLDNAFEAMGEAGELRIQVETGIFKDILPEPTEMVACRLTDNGCGVPAANLPQIFDPFFTTKDVGEGTGLNLAISYALVQSMGGVLTAQSREGHGSTFTIYLPAFE